VPSVTWDRKASRRRFNRMAAAPMYGRLPIVKMLAATLALTAAISAVMLSINWDGQAASTAAPKIDDLLNVMIVLSAFVFSLVCVMLFYALWKFKAKPGDESDGEPIHGNTRLEVAWTIIPTIIVLFGGGYSWKVLHDIEQPVKDAMTVDVFSQQYAWSFGYPGKGNAWSQGELHVPVNRQIQFKMHAQDVIHSFWVPEWRIKKDNVPGITTTAIVTPDKVGTYQLICTELCGFGHASMRAVVVVEPPGKFQKWVAGLKEEVPKPLQESITQANETNPEPLSAGGA
jgi:cytochrome c oxidase subunit 2